MSTQPRVEPGEWIRVGDESGVDAVVVQSYPDETAGCEVVYLDRRNRAINEDVRWDAQQWRFKRDGPCGGYADKYDRLQPFVSLLRRGRAHA